jgi:hypothetical protein
MRMGRPIPRCPLARLQENWAIRSAVPCTASDGPDKRIPGASRPAAVGISAITQQARRPFHNLHNQNGTSRTADLSTRASASMTGSAARGLGLSLVYELASSSAACTSAVAAVSAAMLYRPVASCAELSLANEQSSAWPYDQPTQQYSSTAGAKLATREELVSDILRKAVQ